MDVNINLTLCSLEIDTVFKKNKIDKITEIEILVQMLVKRYLIHFENDKQLLISMIEESYDIFEEDANIRGYL